MNAIEILPLSPSFAAELRGVDLAQELDPPAVDTIRQAFVDHPVLLFRDQSLTVDDQVRVAGTLGTVGQHLRPRRQRGDRPDFGPSVMMVTNEREDDRPIGYLPDGEMMFHTDSCFREIPHKATLLYGVDVTTHGGHTLFADMAAAYEALSDDLRARLRGLEAANVYEFDTTIKAGRYDRERAPHWTHPVVRRHPDTGRLFLYVNELMTEEIVGLEAAESRDLLETLFRHQRDTAFQYEHVWRLGDLVIWDNRCILHARTDFPSTERRTLRRIAVEDEFAVLREQDPPPVAATGR